MPSRGAPAAPRAHRWESFREIASGAGPRADAASPGSPHAQRGSLRLLPRARLHTRASSTLEKRTAQQALDLRRPPCSGKHVVRESSYAIASLRCPRAHGERCGRYRAEAPHAAVLTDQGAPALRVASMGQPPPMRKRQRSSIQVAADADSRITRPVTGGSSSDLSNIFSAMR